MKYIIFSAACLSIFSTQLRAQCSNSTLNGTYVYSFGGTVANPANTLTTLNYSEQGTLTFNGAGTITGNSSTSTAGAVNLSNNVSGTYSINSNCSGTVTLTTGTSTATFAVQVVGSGANALLSVTAAGSGQLGNGTLTLVANANGSQCGNGSLQGTYAVNLSGNVFGGVASTAYQNQGQITFSGTGSATVLGEVTTPNAGATPWSGSGTYTLNSNCTGTLQVTTALGQQTFLIAKTSGGNLILFENNTATTVSGTAVAQSLTEVLPQFAFGGGWSTMIYFTNANASTVTFTVNFVGDNGSALSVPGVGTSQTVTLNPQGTTVIQASNTGPLTQGYVTVSLPAGVSAYAVYTQSQTGLPDQSALVPFINSTSTSESMIFDNTNLTTSVAIVNPSSSPATVTITAWGVNGNVLGTSTVNLAAQSKTEAVLSSFAGLSPIAGQRGSVQFTVSQGSVAVLGVRFGAVAFTSIPVTTLQ